MIITSVGTPLHAARANGISLASRRLGARFSLLDSPSLMGALRGLPNITSKARLLSNVCMRKNGGSRGLFLLSKAPLCRVGRLNKLFSTFGASVVGGISLCGDNFPTHCNNELSSMISMHAGRKGVGRFRKAFSLKLLSNEIRFRKPVVGSGASFGVTVQED